MAARDANHDSSRSTIIVCQGRQGISDNNLTEKSKLLLQIKDLELSLLSLYEKRAESKQIIESLRKEHKELVERMDGFEQIALRTLEKLKKAEQSVAQREDRLREFKSKQTLHSITSDIYRPPSAKGNEL